jgi:hypothetical protein
MELLRIAMYRATSKAAFYNHLSEDFRFGLSKDYPESQLKAKGGLNGTSQVWRRIHEARCAS